MKAKIPLIGIDSLLIISFAFFDIMTGRAEMNFRASFLVTFTILYVLTDIAGSFITKKFFSYLKMIFFSFIVLLIVAIPMLENINIRHTSVNYLFIHDGALQTEIAVRYLFKGIDPYSQSYFGTPLAQMPYFDPENPKDLNPALYHFVYFPFNLERAIPGQVIQKELLGWVDIRFTIFFEYLGILLLVLLLSRDLSDKLTFLILFGLNPLVTHFILEGRNDMSAFFYLLFSLFLLTKKHFKASAVLFALALAFKQTLWLIGPILLYFMFLNKDTKSKFISYVSIVIIVFALAVGPFFLWEPKNFIDSTIGYLSGNTFQNYPVKSIGFAGFLILTNFIKDHHSNFPFWIIQLAFVGPIYFIALKYMRKNLSLSYVLLTFGVIEAVFLYFSRVFSDSYFTLVYLIFVTAYLFYEREKKKEFKQDSLALPKH